MQVVKYLVPHWLWRWIRFNRITRHHKSCRKKIEYLLRSINQGILSEITPLKHFPDNKKIIWQYWAQGFEKHSMPPLISTCLRSVEDHSQGYILIRLSDENLSDYIKFPDWLEKKIQNMTKALFSDLLRCILLAKYGGLWLDAATFLTGQIPVYITDSDFFVYQRDALEQHKKYWEGTFAYYWNWSPDFLVKALTGIMYARKGVEPIVNLASMQLEFWKNHESAPDYFFFQILIELYFRKHPQARPKTVNDTIPHLLRQYINECPAPGYSFEDILKRTTVHSLNYKSAIAFSNLSALFPEYCKSNN